MTGTQSLFSDLDTAIRHHEFAVLATLRAGTQNEVTEAQEALNEAKGRIVEIAKEIQEEAWRCSTVASSSPLPTLGGPETLAACRTPDGRIHAHYPTGLTTLCGKAIPTSKNLVSLPDCGVCSKAARTFDRIDGSMPEHWRPGNAYKPPRARLPRKEWPGLPVGPGPRYGWTRTDLVIALHAWNALMGRPPSARDWNNTPGPGWPSLDTFKRVFGTWNNGMVAAGYPARPLGRPAKVAA